MMVCLHKKIIILNARESLCLRVMNSLKIRSQ